MDKARVWTDKELKHMEKRIRNIYVKSYNDIADKWLAYMEHSAKRINTLQDSYDKAVKAGDIDKIAQTKEALYNAKMSQTFRSQYYKDMIDVTAQNITNVNQTATAYINGQLPKVASVNYNQLAKEADKVGVAFNLVDEHTVMKMIRDNDIKLPYKELDPAKDIPWNTKKLNSAVLQGIVQGESMDKIAKRLMPIVGQNSNASIRTARTCVTGAENAGRVASYKELENKGTVMMKVWIATGDERTRESHLELDGEEVPIDEPFSNDLMYPADPDGDPEESYNCRCALRSHIVGFVDSKTGELIEVSERAKTGHTGEIEREKERRKEAEKQAEKKSSKPTAQMNDGIMKLLRNSGISNLKVNKLSETLSSTEIIDRLCGGDLTRGSCSSLTYAYIGNKHGYDVLDFRGGSSQAFFSRGRNILDIDSPLKESTHVLELTKEASDLAKKLKELNLPHGKEYKLTCGRHAAIIRNTENGYEYLELQSSKQNGWKPFAYKEKLYEGTEYERTHTVSMAETLHNRFGCRKTADKSLGMTWTKKAELVDVDAYKDLDGFDEMLSYINTEKGAQKKGASGFAK